jgi:hypothetical protein
LSVVKSEILNKTDELGHLIHCFLLIKNKSTKVFLSVFFAR